MPREPKGNKVTKAKQSKIGGAKNYWFCLSDTDRTYLNANATERQVNYFVTNLYENSDGSVRFEGLIQFDKPTKRSAVLLMLGYPKKQQLELVPCGRPLITMISLKEKIVRMGGVEFGKFNDKGSGYRTDLHNPKNRRALTGKGRERSTSRSSSSSSE